MLKTLVTLLLAVLAIVLIGTAVVYSGVINVAADDPHSSPVHALLEVARERSIAVRAEGIEVPDLNDPELIRSGAGNYDAMCVACHLAPGVAGAELNQNLNPAPPDLTNRDRPDDPASDFWVIKHGIKATGMPAWGQERGRPLHLGIGRASGATAVADCDGLPGAGSDKRWPSARRWRDGPARSQ